MGESLLTTPFPRIGGVLHCGDVPAEELAGRFGTPLYVYDAARIAFRVQAFQTAFRGVDHLLAYSVKANGNLAVLRRLNALGCGADITSLGELFRARTAGIDPEKIVFAGVGKTVQEMRAALEAGIYGFNVESASELRRLDGIAAEMGVRAPVALRVNPDVLSPTPHEYTATGHAATKFGVPLQDAAELYRWAADRPHLLVRGIDVHIGSQIVDPTPYLRALGRVLELVRSLAHQGTALEYLDIGGGYGIPYDGGAALDVDGLAGEVVPRVKAAGLKLVLEPGRSLVGDAGVLLTRVEYVKRAGKTFVIVDGGMSDLIRPSHYGGYHAIERVDTRCSRPEEPVDVVGPVCETGDFLARDRVMELPEQGELLAVRTVGAYGFSMASNYNGRLRPAECLVDGDQVELIRKRETLDDLIRGES
ncbi:MAG TPA: diaminopimelate decarboxylase [Longimicrobiales bacterium]|nr:diaminopimelate decarboxylase [Longimicrobiales bacterium]